MQDLMKIKNHGAWVAFEHGHLTEQEFCRQFFSDGRSFDVSGLKQTIFDHMEYLPDVEELLQELHEEGYRMYALSNYAPWYELIENKLKLSRFLSWQFVSCKTGLRKPDPEAFLNVAKTLNEPPSAFIFVDDRQKNVDAARGAGMQAFIRDPKDKDALRKGLSNYLSIESHILR